MNRLQHEESPYLQQHKDNPVDWYSWGEEAFQKAKEEDKPILVSIGYSTCHWCHVMERESFEDKETAHLMNLNFVNIKVDREELPAVDQYYMDAVQVLTGSGGWPLNCFLTPERKPYFGGTYFPPEDRRGQLAWKKVLSRMSNAYKERRDEVYQQADKLAKIVKEGSQRFLATEVKPSEPNSFRVDEWIKEIVKELDLERGGLNAAPKFPSPQLYQFLLHYTIVHKHEECNAAIERTAHAFIDGGLFDPVHGGFARYCVDENWRVPHFEKMLYDNAGILSFLAQMHAFRPHQRWQWAMKRTMGFWTEEMRSENGLFYSAIDADSEGVEGKYYTWTESELKDVLSKKEFELISAYSDIRSNGNWEGTNILYTDPAKRVHFFKSHSEKELNKVLDKLKEASKERTMPGVDEKQLLDWNAMMVTSFLHMSRYGGIDHAAQIAKENLDTLIDVFINDGAIEGHVYKNGKVYANATLDDYAYLIAALIETYEWIIDEKYLILAESLCATAINKFKAEGEVLFMMTDADSNEVVSRQPNYFDNAYPSGNSIMADNLRKLGKIYDKAEWTMKSEEMMIAISESVGKFPTAFNRWAELGFAFEYLNAEIAVMGEESGEWSQQIASESLPGLIIMSSEEKNSKYPLLDRQVNEKETAIFLCQNYSCQLPVYSLKDFSKLRSDTLNY